MELAARRNGRGSTDRPVRGGTCRFPANGVAQRLSGHRAAKRFAYAIERSGRAGSNGSAL